MSYPCTGFADMSKKRYLEDGFYTSLTFLEGTEVCDDLT